MYGGIELRRSTTQFTLYDFYYDSNGYPQILYIDNTLNSLH